MSLNFGRSLRGRPLERFTCCVSTLFVGVLFLLPIMSGKADILYGLMNYEIGYVIGLFGYMFTQCNWKYEVLQRVIVL